MGPTPLNPAQSKFDPAQRIIKSKFRGFLKIVRENDVVQWLLQIEVAILSLL